METTTFATVLRSSEVSLHILVQKGACMSFPCFTVGLSRFTVWMKVKRPSYVLTMNGAIVRFHRFFSSSIFIMQCAKIIILKSVIQNDIVLRLYIYDSYCPFYNHIPLKHVNEY